VRAVIGAFVVLFAVVLQQRGGHSMEEVPDEEARFDAAGPSGYVLRAVEILLERAAKKGQRKSLKREANPLFSPLHHRHRLPANDFHIFYVALVATHTILLILCGLIC
jgi:hypothetical protein